MKTRRRKRRNGGLFRFAEEISWILQYTECAITI